MRRSLMICLVLLLCISIAYAVPARPGTFTVQQPDGEIIEVQQFGDERGAWVETIEGYTIIQDESGHWVYAQLENNQLVSTYELAASHSNPSIEKHTRPSSSQSPTFSGGKLGSVSKTNELLPKGGAPPSEPQKAPVTSAGDLLVILINFTNQGQGAGSTPVYYDNLIFNTSNSSSMWSYYNQTSYGYFNLTGLIAGNKWYNSSRNMSYYGKDGGSCGGSIDSFYSCIFELTREALEQADPDIDFSSYDDNSDNVINSSELNIVVVHAGCGQEDGSCALTDEIWSHKWTIYGSNYGYNDTILDGVELSKRNSNSTYTDVGNYIMLAEDSPVGTFAHEFGHALGLPDLYDTASSSTRVGDWAIMDHGSWNGPSDDGSSPAHFCAWSKYFLGWIDPIIITNGTVSATLNQSEYSNDTTYMLINSSYSGTGNISDSNGTEYFLVENRQKVGFDVYLPGDGLLIWHIDDSVGSISSGGINNNNSHKRVDVESADNTDPSTNYGDTGDPWDNSSTDFTPTSTPDSNFYNGTSSKVKVANISASDSSMNATFTVANSAPSASNVTINPTNATTSDNITCNYTYSDPDNDSENGTLTRWFIDSAENSSLENATTVLSGNTTKDQVWICEVTPSDGTTFGSAVNSSNLTIQNSLPTVNLTAPNGGEAWNSTHNITWSASDVDNDNITIDLQYTYNGTWVTIATNQNNTGNYTWNVTTLTDSSNYTVKIIANDSTNTSEDTSDAVFTIGNAPVVLVIYPNGGESINGTANITANVTDPDGQADIQTVWFYYSNTSSNWTLIGNSTTPVGSEYNISWNTAGLAESLTYQIKVNATDNSSLTDNDTSDANFTVNNVNEAPSITLTEPDTGDKWSGTNTIQWSASDPDGDTLTIDIQVSDDSGSNWDNVSTGETNDGSYSWDTTIYSDDTDYRIKVIASDPGGLTDSASSGDFEIDNVVSNASTSASGDSGLDTGVTDTAWISKTFELVELGKTATWSVPSSSGLALTTVEFTTKEALGDVKLKARKLDEKPSSISVTPAGKIYQYFEMSTNNLPTTSISSIILKFKISQSWLNSSNLDEDSVSIRRWSGTGWTKLTTTKYDSDSTYIYYSAPSVSFSYFTITALEKESAVAAEVPEASKEEGLLAGLGAGVVSAKLSDFLEGQTLGLDNSYWIVIFSANVFMFVFLIIGVRAQQKLRPRPPRPASRWKWHARLLSYGRFYTGRTQQIKPTFFNPLHRGRRR